MSNTLYKRTLWTTQHALLLHHLLIITTINIRHDYRLQQNRRTFTNYKKADRIQLTEGTESDFAQTTIPTNIHTSHGIFTNIILMADNHNIPKSKMHSTCRLLPYHIVCKITQRNNIRRTNTYDPGLKLLNEEITYIHGLSNKTTQPILNTSITFTNKLTTTPKHTTIYFNKQFTNKQHIRQTDPLTGQYIKYKGITSNSGPRGNKTK